MVSSRTYILTLFGFEGIFTFRPSPNHIGQKSGGYSEEATPVPISNTVVKLFCADDTWRATAWESRTSPVFLIRPHGQAVKTPPFHGGNPGSIPGGVTNIKH